VSEEPAYRPRRGKDGEPAGPDKPSYTQRMRTMMTPDAMPAAVAPAVRPNATPGAAEEAAVSTGGGAPRADAAAEPKAWAPASGWSLPEIAWVLLATIAVSVMQGVLLKSDAILGVPVDEQLLVRGAVVAVYYLVLLAFVWWLAARRSRPIAEAVGLRRFDWPRTLLAVAGYLVAVWATIIAYAMLLRLAEVRINGSGTDVTTFFGLSTMGILVTILIAGVFGPFVEEVVFRGVVYSGLADIMPGGVAVFASASLFALLHFNAYLTLPAFIVGVGLALIYKRRGSLWASVMLHAAYNVSLIVFAYALQPYLPK
jgi:membrane protease YdiL (CAAX protease family)